MTRELQVVHTDGSTRLTISVTRVTLKCNDDCDILKKFALRVAQELGDVLSTWRGHVRVSDVSVGVELQTNNKQCKKLYILKTDL